MPLSFKIAAASTARRMVGQRRQEYDSDDTGMQTQLASSKGAGEGYEGENPGSPALIFFPPVPSRSI